MFSYRSMLKNSARLTWQNKNLWFFGLFATIFGLGAEYDFILNFFMDKTSDKASIFSMLNESGILNTHLLANVASAFARNPAVSGIALLVLLMIIFLVGFVVWLVVVSIGAIINNSGQIIGGKSVQFRDGAEVGMKKFWPIFSLAAAQKILVSLFILTLGYSALYSVGNFRLVYIVLFVLFLLSVFTMTMLFRFSLSLIILKGKNIKTALKDAWELALKNWVIVVEMELILLGISSLAVIVIFFVTLNFTFVLLLLVNLLIKLNPVLGFWSMILFILLVAVAIVVASILLTTFVIIAWNNLFIELIGGGGTSKLMRLVSRSEKNKYDASFKKD
jgi:hypothetical protein